MKSLIIALILLSVAIIYMTWQFGRSYGQHEINCPATQITTPLSNFA